MLVRKKTFSILAGAGVALALMAPTGGLPSRPTFQQVTVNGPLSAGAATLASVTANNASGATAVYATTNSASSPAFYAQQFGTGAALSVTNTGGGVALYVGSGPSQFQGVTATTLTSSGAATLASLTGPVSITAPATSAFALTVTGYGTTGSSMGVQINAGTNSADYPLYINNHAGSYLYAVHGDGGVNIGAGYGSPGNGGLTTSANLNVYGGLYVGGVKQPRLSYGVIGGSGTCAIWSSYQSSNLASCSRTSAGQYSINFTTGYTTTQPSCVLTSIGTDAYVNALYVIGANTTTLQVENCDFATTGTCTQTDKTQIAVTCVGT